MPEQAILSSVKATELSTAKFMAETTCLLVDHPDQVDVKTWTDGSCITVRLSVAPDDIGKIIGKQGRTARSLRVLLAAISSKTGIRFALDIQAERT